MLITNKVAFISGVMVLVDTDMGLVSANFPDASMVHRGEFIEYDSILIKNKVPKLSSLRDSPHSKKKQSKDVVRLAPFVFNLKQSTTVADTNITQFGENAYSTNPSMTTKEAAMLEPMADLMRDIYIGQLYVAGQVLMKGIVPEGYHGTEGVEDIEMNIPAENLETLDNVTNLFWTDADSNPLEDILRMYMKMKVKPTRLIMSQATYALIESNKNVYTASNNTDGKAINFVKNMNPNPELKYYSAGTIVGYRGMNIEIFIETQTVTLSDGVTSAQVIEDGFVIFASNGMGSTEFTAIPVSQDNGNIELVAEKIHIGEDFKKYPAVHDVVLQTSMLTLIKNPHAYARQKVIAGI